MHTAGRHVAVLHKKGLNSTLTFFEGLLPQNFRSMGVQCLARQVVLCGLQARIFCVYHRHRNYAIVWVVR